MRVLITSAGVVKKAAGRAATVAAASVSMKASFSRSPCMATLMRLYAAKYMAAKGTSRSSVAEEPRYRLLRPSLRMCVMGELALGAMPCWLAICICTMTISLGEEKSTCPMPARPPMPISRPSGSRPRSSSSGFAAWRSTPLTPNITAFSGATPTTVARSPW